MREKHTNSIGIVLIFYSFILITSCNVILFKNKNAVKKSFYSISDTNHIGHIIQYRKNGTKESEIDTITGYRKYWYENGKVEMEGKVTHGSLGDYRDSVWKYYSDSGFLTSIETYNSKGKVNSKKFLYYNNYNPMTETYEFFEGDAKLDKANFKFHKIEKIFYYEGGIYSERHSINGKIVKMKCWNRRGIRRPLKYLKKHSIAAANNNRGMPSSSVSDFLIEDSTIREII